MTTTPDDTTSAPTELRITAPRTLTCETLVYLLRDECGRPWIGYDEPTKTHEGGVMGHLVPGGASKEGSVRADGDHVVFVIPASGEPGTDGLGVAYLAPPGLFASLDTKPRPEGSAADVEAPDQG